MALVKQMLLAILMLLVVVPAGCSSGLLEWTYPELKQLGVYEPGSSYQEWDGLENPGWDPEALEARVTELAREYKAAHPPAPGHVCWDMAMGLWQVLKDNGITSFIATSKAEIEQWGETDLVLNHVWLVVLGGGGLNLGIECITGVTYSPSYMRPYELRCEQAYRDYGLSSPEWDAAKSAYDKAYSEYERYLEGYFYRDPTALKAILFSR